MNNLKSSPISLFLKGKNRALRDMFKIAGRWTPSGWTIELVTHDADVIMKSSSQLLFVGLPELAAKT